MLAIELGIPIIPMIGCRTRLFFHRLQFQPLVYLNNSFHNGQLREATDQLNNWMEQTIREKPDNWFYWFQAEERWGL